MEAALTSDIRFLKGVGEQRAALYGKLGIHTLEELLHHLPRSYLDLSHPVTVAQAQPGETVAIRAVVTRSSGEQRLRGGLSVFKITAVDEEGGVLLITYFNAKYTALSLKVEQEYLFYGKVGGTLLRREMASPQVFPPHTRSPLLPVYPLTAGITSRTIQGHMELVLPLAQGLEDSLPDAIRRRCQLATLPYAMEAIHRPDSLEAVSIARRRLIFDELFTLALGMGLLSKGREVEKTAPLPPVDMAPFYRALPFSLTGAQQRAIGEALRDLATSRPMNRLIQGDVGSGKTMVAAACAYYTAKNSCQAALMAPTELLAEQHLRTLGPLLEPLGLRVALLTGSLPSAAKRKLKAAIAAGEVDLVIGTHALLTKDVAFASLALVVTDEQHRFGVTQRAALADKGQRANLLVMSATPIPRTLALIIYGDLELSVIDELPPGRTPVKTYWIDSPKRQRAYGFIRKHLEAGRQAYIVCPLIEQGEMTQDLTPAVDLAHELETGPFAGCRVGLLHGRMKAADKESTMRRFAAGDIQLLVSTTVVEVGMDVPNAVMMMVENAERFGLSQLHQLRGRVGRGSYESHCILLSDNKGEDNGTRLGVMCRTTDGFRIAQEDLQLRGPGDFFGSRQHGLPQLKIADLATDMALLQAAQDEAGRLLAQDPDLTHHPALRKAADKLLASAASLN